MKDLLRGPTGIPLTLALLLVVGCFLYVWSTNPQSIGLSRGVRQSIEKPINIEDEKNHNLPDNGSENWALPQGGSYGTPRSEEVPGLLAFIATVSYTDEWGSSATSSFFRYDSPDRDWVFVYRDLENSLLTEYSLYRVYPYPISNSAIATNLQQVPLAHSSFIEQLQSMYPKEALLSDNLIDDTESMTIGTFCRDYFGGERCIVTAHGGSYGLSEGVLSSTTGPYHLPINQTLSGLYALDDGKVLVQTGFGDAGASMQEYSIWDTTHHTHTKVSSWDGMYAESATITLGDVRYEFQSFYNSETQNMERGAFMPDLPFFDLFASHSPLERERAQSPLNYLVTTTLMPQDRTDATAPWLIIYTYGQHVASAVYEFDPKTKKIRQYASGVTFH